MSALLVFFFSFLLLGHGPPAPHKLHPCYNVLKLSNFKLSKDAGVQSATLLKKNCFTGSFIVQSILRL